MDHSASASGNVAVVREYGAYLRVEKGLRPSSIEAYVRDIEQFAEFLEKLRDGVLTGAMQADVSGFLEELRANAVESRSVARKLSALRGLFRWLLMDKRTKVDPTLNIVSPSVWKILPKSLAESEMKGMLDAAEDAAKASDAPAAKLRDSAILELLYGGGLRVGEICALREEDLKLDMQRAQVRGKGDKERIVPLGRTVCAVLERYLELGRPALVRRGAGLQRALFLSTRGNGLTRQWVWEMVRRASPDGTASPHKLRHSCATHMVEHGADLRSVQTFLGHADIATTQMYTHVALGHLKEVHRKHHPRGRMRAGAMSEAKVAS
jgi:integrase/recombinase XerD